MIFGINDPKKKHWWTKFRLWFIPVITGLYSQNRWMLRIGIIYYTSFISFTGPERWRRKGSEGHLRKWIVFMNYTKYRRVTILFTARLSWIVRCTTVRLIILKKNHLSLPSFLLSALECTILEGRSTFRATADANQTTEGFSLLLITYCYILTGTGGRFSKAGRTRFHALLGFANFD